MSVWNINSQDFSHNGSLRDKIKFLLGFAILAPSAHNAQPWLCRISEDKLIVKYDKRYRLAFSDPVDRQAYISIGAFASNFSLAAYAFGMKVTIDWFPQGETAAEIKIFGGDKKNFEPSVIKSMIQRRVNRGNFNDKNIPENLVKAIKSLGNDIVMVDVVEHKNDINKIADCIALGTAFAFKNEKFRRELAQYVIPNISSRLDGIPGNTAQLGLVKSLAMPKIIERFDIGSSQSLVENLRFKNSAAIVILSTAFDDKKAWVETGYIFEQMALLLTQHSVAHSISAAPIEAPQLFQKVQKMVNSDYRPQMIVRLGYASTQPPHSPRRPVSAILK